MAAYSAAAGRSGEKAPQESRSWSAAFSPAATRAPYSIGSSTSSVMLACRSKPALHLNVGRFGRAILGAVRAVLRAKAREAGWISLTRFSNAPTVAAILSSRPGNNSSSSINNSRTIRNAASNAKRSAHRAPARALPAPKRGPSAPSAERKPPFPSSRRRGALCCAVVVFSKNGR